MKHLRFMYWMQNQSKYENTAYIALWGLLFAAPLLSLFVRTMNDSTTTFDWQEVWVVWRMFGIYLILFLIHNFILAPLLVYGRKRWLYFVLTAALLVAFTFYQCSSRPDDFRHRPHPEARMHDGPPEFEDDFEQHNRPAPPHFERKDGHRPPVMVGQHDIVSVIILILMFGMNLGIKLYFKNRGDQKKLAALEKENLEQQLEYLKYQINPHFFMNTLNNIHALVDIDPEKAKGTILELSKMMRFILYEGDKKGVPLSREFDFIRNYITLMKLRYTDKVRINADLPTEVPDRLIPPLMLITFIENAFKHGVSYQHDSFIDIKVAISDWQLAVSPKLNFTCRNSKANGKQPTANSQQGGVGLANVKQRLKLLYDNNFTLKIQDNDTYNVELTIPLL